MFRIWDRREKPAAGPLVWKVLLAVGIVGVGIGAELLRRRVMIRVPKSELTIRRGRAKARLHVEVGRRGGRTVSANGRRGARRSRSLRMRVSAA